MKRRFGQVAPDSKEWTLQRVPKERVAVTRASLESLQAELRMLREIALEAEHISRILKEFNVYPVATKRLFEALDTYGGWVELTDQRDAIVDSLQRMVEELSHEESRTP